MVSSISIINISAMVLYIRGKEQVGMRFLLWVCIQHRGGPAFSASLFVSSSSPFAFVCSFSYSCSFILGRRSLVLCVKCYVCGDVAANHAEYTCKSGGDNDRTDPVRAHRMHWCGNKTGWKKRRKKKQHCNTNHLYKTSGTNHLYKTRTVGVK